MTQGSQHINCGQLTARVTGSHPHLYVGGAHLRMLAPALVRGTALFYHRILCVLNALKDF